MKPLALLAVGLAIGWAASGVEWSRDAVGQDSVIDVAPLPDDIEKIDPSGDKSLIADPAPVPLQAPFASPAVNRYKLDAFNMSTGNGYYILDAMTGRLRYGTNGSKPQLIASELPEK